MTEHVVTGGPTDSISRIAAQMQRHNIGSVVVVENRKAVGILTERDFVRIVERIGMMMNKDLAKDHMTKPVVTVQSDTPVTDIIKLMREKHVRHLIVLNKDREVAGIVSYRDLMKVTEDLVPI